MEITEAMPHAASWQPVQAALIDSIAWRSWDSFSESTLEEINAHALKSSRGWYAFLDVLLRVAPLPSHPYNADFLHRNLLSWSMPERDALWSTWLHHAWQEEGSAVRRLVDWAWQGGEKAHLDDEAVRFAGIALA